MLGDGVDPEIRDRYRASVVTPRRTRIRACLNAAIDRGELDADADLQIAATFLTGSWYAMALSGVTPPKDWPRRTATLVWRACGGRPPG